ncbi:glycoside hydrolase family protein [Synechococcus sp. CCY9202]|uniref:glycoside hydrolase family protein n=1 Tax=Synechococcus sp. CCY9202 TaxID=174698 RepID=UPI002B1F7190|nr:glycoside hydrolase family protein [Synechococcus sp. CCY9202]MEA5423561.1 glycoside hydrolase family protein [Synechococcus sp. CCY9202]
MSLTPEGWQLLKRWEGCRLVAYPDPASGGDPWTIGYGHTGVDVTPGLVISQPQAEAWLEADVAVASAAVDRLLAGCPLNPFQRDALVSFCFNVGAGALEGSTLRRRLRAGEAAASVIAEELPRWCKGPGGPVEGLIRRREAEVQHALSFADGAPEPQPQPQAQASTPIQLLQAVAHFRDLPHQRQAWSQLQALLTPEQLQTFAMAYRQGSAQPPQTTVPPLATPAAAAKSAATGLLQLAVPYLSQNDSVTSQGPRMCFSSSCAMAAAFLRPGCLSGSGQIDDQYLALVRRHGDTTDAVAQVRALADLGLRARLRQDGRLEDLVAQLQRGIPAPVGWLHKGSVTAPSGGGHWSLVIGWDPERRQLLIHDPNGEADLVNGGYVTNAIGSGKNLRYSERNWGRRWMVEGPGSGWWLELLGGG